MENTNICQDCSLFLNNFTNLGMAFLLWQGHQLTFVLVAGEGTLATGEDPEHEVGHPEGEGDDGVAEDESQHQDHQWASCRD